MARNGRAVSVPSVVLALIVAAGFGSPGHAVVCVATMDTLPIKIGLLLPADGDPRAIAVRRAVRLRVAVANEAGGVRGRPVEIVERAVDGPWGAGTGEIVRIVFEDEVLGVIGGLDGRTAHLIEQVVAKGRVVMLSPWASDPTLSGAFVPWFFRMVPSDRHQAVALWQEILRRGRTPVAMIVADTYDARAAADAFEREGSAFGYTPTRLAGWLDCRTGLSAPRVPRDVDAIVVWGPPREAGSAVRALRRGGFAGLLVTGLRGADPRFVASAGPAVEGMLLVVAGHEGTRLGADFNAAFRDRFGDTPTAVAAYAYDAVTTLLDAIERVGTDRDAVRAAIAAGSFSGVTGTVRFEPSGDREGSVALADAGGGSRER